MHINTEPFDSLLTSAERYNKRNLELLKLKSVDKTADVASTFVSRGFLAIVLSFLTITLSIGASLWLGEILGKTYFGFFVISLMYAVLAVILVIAHKPIKRIVGDSIVVKMLN
jgi:hypothetical protein